MLEIVKKKLISLFIILNLLTIFAYNKPAWVTRKTIGLVSANFSPQKGIKIKQKLKKFFYTYGHFVGLDHTWIMFSRQPEYHWWVLIKVYFNNSKDTTIDLLNREKTTLSEKLFFNFYVRKFIQNLLRNNNWKKAYSNYLCRTYSKQGEKKVYKVVFELYKQNIYPPNEARAKKVIYNPSIEKKEIFTYICPKGDS